MKNSGSIIKKDFPKNLMVTQEPERAINGCPPNGGLTTACHRMKFFGGKNSGCRQRRLDNNAAHDTFSDESLKLR
ncbi:MAG: hypothetical protein SFU53_10765 [Terrimicrobiaceae bacterium]|nr:hypothetical protein [Terrimicrobiaceae bacterium]